MCISVLSVVVALGFPWENWKLWQKGDKEVLLYSTGNYIKSLGIDHDGR